MMPRTEAASATFKRFPQFFAVFRIFSPFFATSLPCDRHSSRTWRVGGSDGNEHASLTGDRVRRFRLQLQSLERLVYGRPAQKMISDRVGLISTELGQLKMHITRLSIHPLQSKAILDELRYHRRAAQMCAQDLEDVILLASPDTLAVFGMRTWAQFVGKIWTPMMNLLFFNEKPISTY